ncbi:hypothetical protein MSAN_00146600 [Mycena sanguinolenta]|uniref:Uncharacterized protein n=1 Tax=Mycena sanguinolenta TaxID=230812 RepID=A0A8H7DLZ7_9AGAR|nr:hypothetical protein MSAN_00146600 [Mycena sanguinolenta]
MNLAPDLQPSRIIRSLRKRPKASDGSYLALDNLWKYHLHQMKLLGRIAKDIDERMSELMNSTDYTTFCGTVKTAALRLGQLNRMLGWGSISAWLQMKDTQDALATIQWRLVVYTTGHLKHRGLFSQEIGFEFEEDDRETHEQVAKLTDRLRNKALSPQVMIGLFPPISPTAWKEMIGTFLEKFLTSSPTVPDNLRRLMESMGAYNGELAPEDFVPLHVLRTHTGQIITMISASSSERALHEYCRQFKSNVGPRLYIPARHDGFVIDTTYLRRCPDSMKLSMLQVDTPTIYGTESEMYIVEQCESDHFLFASALGSSNSLEIIKLESSITRSLIEDITSSLDVDENDNDWKICRSQYKWTPDLRVYEHQLIVPGTKKNQWPRHHNVRSPASRFIHSKHRKGKEDEQQTPWQPCEPAFPLPVPLFAYFVCVTSVPPFRPRLPILAIYSSHSVTLRAAATDPSAISTFSPRHRPGGGDGGGYSRPLHHNKPLHDRLHGTPVPLHDADGIVVLPTSHTVSRVLSTDGTVRVPHDGDEGREKQA